MVHDKNTKMENRDVLAFAEQILNDRIFMGDFQEKRYVKALNKYRDLIVLNKHEKILCDDLTKVKNKLLSENRLAYCGFTSPMELDAPGVYCIWTTIDNIIQTTSIGSQLTASVGFGEYWFQIKSIDFANANSMEIKVTVLRPIDVTTAMSSGPSLSLIAQQALEVDTTKIQQYVQDSINVNWSELINQWFTSINQKMYCFLSTEITWQNFINCILMFGILSVALIQMSVQFVYTLGEWSIRLISELNKLIKVSTPIILAIINLFSKMIGGLYILLAMIWRDLFHGDSRNNKNTNERRSYYGYNSQRPSITYHGGPRAYSFEQQPTTTSSRIHYNRFSRN